MKTLIPVYCISGLGADETVFEHISLPGCEIVHLPWIQPEPGEAITHYAERMSRGIRHPQPILMGLSFGGMMAVEISRFISARRVWLISTIKHRGEMPPYMRFGGVLPLHRIALSLNINRWMGRLENFNLAVETPEEEAMVERFRQTVDKDYLRWAIDVIVRWQNTETPPGVLHIHGDRDRIFPIRHLQPDHVVEGGGHFLIHNRSAVVNSLLQEDLSRNFS